MGENTCSLEIHLKYFKILVQAMEQWPHSSLVVPLKAKNSGCHTNTHQKTLRDGEEGQTGPLSGPEGTRQCLCFLLLPTYPRWGAGKATTQTHQQVHAKQPQERPAPVSQRTRDRAASQDRKLFDDSTLLPSDSGKLLPPLTVSWGLPGIWTPSLTSSKEAKRGGVWCYQPALRFPHQGPVSGVQRVGELALPRVRTCYT